MEIVDDLAALIRRLEEVEKKQAALQAERDHYHALYLEMLERCRKLEKGLVGPKSERLSGDESQLTIGVLETLLSERDLAEIDELAKANEREVKAHNRKKPTGRKPLPDHLPRVDIEVLPEEVLPRTAFEGASGGLRDGHLRRGGAGPRVMGIGGGGGRTEMRATA